MAEKISGHIRIETDQGDIQISFQAQVLKGSHLLWRSSLPAVLQQTVTLDQKAKAMLDKKREIIEREQRRSYDPIFALIPEEEFIPGTSARVVNLLLRNSVDSLEKLVRITDDELSHFRLAGVRSLSYVHGLQERARERLAEQEEALNLFGGENKQSN